MKSIARPICLLILLLTTASSAELPTNNVGIYFDELGNDVCAEEIGAYPAFLSAYVVLKNLSCPNGIGGWEARLDWDENLVISLFEIRGDELQLGSFPNLVVGLGSPILPDSVAVLAELSVMAIGPGGIYLKPADSPLITGAESPIFIFWGDEEQFALMNYAYGDSGSACAVVGNMVCPELNEYQGSVPDSSNSDLSHQLIVVARRNAIQLPDSNEPAAFTDIVFASPSLQKVLSSQDPLSVRRVITRETNRTPVSRGGSSVPLLGGNDAFVIDVGRRSARDELLSRLLSSRDILSVEENGLVSDLMVQPNDPGYTAQWGLHGSFGTNASLAWDHSTGSTGVTICVVDQGVRDGHEEFLGKRSGSISYSGDHGAQVAGIAAAVADNQIGIAGVSWGARLNLQRRGESVADAAAAISSGLNANPDIMNHSYRLLTSNNSNIYSPLVHRLFMDAYKLGVVHSVASGNQYEEGNPYIYPARNGWAWDGYAQGMIVAGGVDELGQRYTRSTSGPHVDLVAPAVDVVSTTNGGYVGPGEDGTSYSAPHVAGAAALLLSIRPDLDPDDIEAFLNLSAIDLYGPGRDDLTGWGRLNIEAAIDSLTMNDFVHVGFSGSAHSSTLIETWLSVKLEGFPNIDPDPLNLDLIRVQRNVTFPQEYYEPPHVWGRGNGSTGLPAYPWYNIPFTKVVEGSVTTTGCTLETYVYRLEVDCPWTPPPNCPPDFYLPSSYCSPWYILDFEISILGRPIPPTAVDGMPIAGTSGNRLTVEGPNPFNAKVILQIELKNSAAAGVFISDISGRRVRTIAAGLTQIGELRFAWDGRDDSGRMMPSGVYFAVLEQGENRESNKVVLLK